MYGAASAGTATLVGELAAWERKSKVSLASFKRAKALRLRKLMAVHARDYRVAVTRVQAIKTQLRVGSVAMVAAKPATSYSVVRAVNSTGVSTTSRVRPWWVDEPLARTYPPRPGETRSTWSNRVAAALKAARRPTLTYKADTQAYQTSSTGQFTPSGMAVPASATMEAAEKSVAPASAAAEQSAAIDTVEAASAEAGIDEPWYKSKVAMGAGVLALVGAAAYAYKRKKGGGKLFSFKMGKGGAGASRDAAPAI